MKKVFIAISIFLITFSNLSFAAKDERTFRISKNLSIFNSVFRELDLNYVDTLNYDKMAQTAIGAMLQQLDPYTVYIAEEQSEDITFMTKGEYAGIGALISKGKNGVYISDPYEGKPAQKNDVRAGDIILEVDGQDVSKLSVSEVSSRLRGVPNTTITLKLERPGVKKAIEKQFIREKIQMEAISYSSVFDNKIGYILLSDFTDHAALEIKNSLDDMIKQQQIESLILDLRGNGGGLIDEAVKILGFFLPKGTSVVTTRGSSPASERVYRTPSHPIYPDMKLTVLTNSSSASASEIIAGAIQDLDRGIIIGERTFGKGLVQSIRPVNFGGHLKVTTAKYYIPSGRCIQAIDYSHRNDDGSVGRVPDSLTTLFYTKNGRPVRDGGGIIPDKTIEDNRKMNIAYYIYAQNHYFDFATLYVLQHPQIATPDKFELSDADFKAFTDYLIEKNFSYTSQTEKYFDDLLELAKYEGLDESAKEEFAALKSKLTPEISTNIEKNKKDIGQLLSAEIIKRYYFQKGEIQYSLRSDEVIETALSILKSNEEYTKTLTKE